MTRLVLHIGLPKTATTTIQDWAADTRGTLAKAGVVYPRSFLQGSPTKHQELAVTLMSGVQQPVQDLFDDIAGTLAASPAAHTVLLSTEGLVGHLPEGEAQPAHLAALREYFARFSEVVLFVMRRDPRAWVRSYHQQKVCNPPGPRFDHGTAMTLEAFRDSPRTRALMDHDALLARTRTAYGAQTAHTAWLEQDWQQDLCDLLDAPALAASLAAYPRSNTGLTPAGTEIMRQINAYGLPHSPLRAELVAWLRNNSDTPLDPQLDPVIAALIPQDDDQRRLVAKMRSASSGPKP